MIAKERTQFVEMRTTRLERLRAPAISLRDNLPARSTAARLDERLAGAWECSNLGGGAALLIIGPTWQIVEVCDNIGRRLVALVVLLRGVNVGGHRSFRPAAFADQLQRFDAVNVGSTGVFVIKRPVSRTQLRAEIQNRLPFDAEVMICHGRELIGLLTHPAFAGCRAGPNDVRFVSILSRRPRSIPQLPITMPPHSKWLVNIIACDGRFVLGVYRRHMKVIRYLGSLDRLFGATATTRSLGTIEAIAAKLVEQRRL